MSQSTFCYLQNVGCSGTSAAPCLPAHHHALCHDAETVSKSPQLHVFIELLWSWCFFTKIENLRQ